MAHRIGGVVGDGAAGCVIRGWCIDCDENGFNGPMYLAMNAMPPKPGRNATPLWMPVLAGLAMGIALVLLAIPLYGHGAATASRMIHVVALAIWMLPLTLLQRAMWRRDVAAWRMALALLAAAYAMALMTRLAILAWQAPLGTWSNPFGMDWLRLFRGLESAWLTLVVFCAIHFVVVYYAELRQERLRRSQAQALLADAELRALRYQLQPHFLFNTLNAISALILVERNDDARKMISGLAEFLRATLEGAHAHEVTLAEELAFSDAYLEIEKARLGERLRLVKRIGPGVLDARVPCLLLQPLLENAIAHGIAQRRASGCVEIDIRGTDGVLQVEVSNDVATDQRQPPAIDSEPRQGGLGLTNVRERLGMLYASRHGMEAGIGADGRYRVSIRFPLHKSTEQGR